MQKRINNTQKRAIALAKKIQRKLTKKALTKAKNAAVKEMKKITKVGLHVAHDVTNGQLGRIRDGVKKALNETTERGKKGDILKVVAAAVNKKALKKIIKKKYNKK